MNCICASIGLDEDLSREVEALAHVHTHGDVAEMVRLLLLKSLRPDRFVEAMASREVDAA